MKKFLLSLLLVTAMVCEKIMAGTILYRCENSEVVCYVNKYNGGISCKFKEDIDELV